MVENPTHDHARVTRNLNLHAQCSIHMLLAATMSRSLRFSHESRFRPNSHSSFFVHRVIMSVICGHCGKPCASTDGRCMCVPPGFWDRPAVTKAVRVRDARTVLHLLHHSAPHLTHEALAAMCGVDQSTITRALNGRGLTRPDVAVRALNRLGALPISTDSTIQTHTPSPSSQWRARLDE
ncbi:helix-turn-helix domain-containing protein [Nocardiopsis sp. NPDC006938]|uniref:helix-turn-helix domain-containing protein n=1 Tax=Nocardiopsis sp. NPDC006938 TaxID=3364337 RepID=UPI00367E005D